MGQQIGTLFGKSSSRKTRWREPVSSTRHPRQIGHDKAGGKRRRRRDKKVAARAAKEQARRGTATTGDGDAAPSSADTRGKTKTLTGKAGGRQAAASPDTAGEDSAVAWQAAIVQDGVAVAGQDVGVDIRHEDGDIAEQDAALPVSEKAVLSWDKTALPVGKMTVMSASQEAPLLLSKLLPDEKTVLLSNINLPTKGKASRAGDGAAAVVRSVQADGSTKARVVADFQVGHDGAAIRDQVTAQLEVWSQQLEADQRRRQHKQEAAREADVAAIDQAVRAEQERRDEAMARTLRDKASELRAAAAAAEEEARQLHKKMKRQERTRTRRARRANQEVVAALGAGNSDTVITGAGTRAQLEAGDYSSINVETPDVLDAVLKESRARRRQIRKVRKARAKERRELQAALDELERDDRPYFAYGDANHRRGAKTSRKMSVEEAWAVGYTAPSVTKGEDNDAGRRRRAKYYNYHSGSVYMRPRVQRTANDHRPMRVGHLRAVQAPATSTLPTARVTACRDTKEIKLDTGVQYSVAGEEWQAYGERQNVLPPVDYVEGFTGALTKVLGVWRFAFRTQYDQLMVVDALVVSGAPTEILLGEDWMLTNGVKIDFTACEMKWWDDGNKKIVPFSCSSKESESTRTVQVRMVRTAKVTTNTYQRVELAVAAHEGTTGLSVPAQRVEPHLMLAPTLTTVRNGKVMVPVMNLVGSKATLPAREALGTWAPTTDDLEVIELAGDLTRDGVMCWLRELGGGRREPPEQ
ncbi:hypothetical protein PF011_g25410 [Phytophthora fragariae]|uniref:Peptidase A2 domain-containing protein n=1 Tax=Phytophthora fragariae TaxID=53985 RepID=A0A6A3HQW8_9STRA|nr:hypothetical protein PF011_g25410 [Phytophthora fragariae]